MTGGTSQRSGNGALFIATGQGHVEAAGRAAASVRSTNPDLRIGLFSDVEPRDGVFDDWSQVTDPHSRSKVDFLPRTPYRNTLYLDTDIRVLSDLGPMFRLLDRFDMALAQVVRWHKEFYLRAWRQDVPESFPQYNGGVVLFRSTPEGIAFFEAWRDDYHAAGFEEDQVTLRELLWMTLLRVATLPPQFNMRSYTLRDRFFSQRADPRILHLTKYNPGKRGVADRLFGPIRRALSGPHD